MLLTLARYLIVSDYGYGLKRRHACGVHEQGSRLSTGAATIVGEADLGPSCLVRGVS